MRNFLTYIAEDIIRKYGSNLSRTVVVFPNKRASLFLNEALAKAAGRPLWSPVYITISELFRQQSAWQVADPIKLVCELHRSYTQMTGSTETLDQFYGWGQLLISDFDDVDKNMADADKVFANIQDIHELDDVSYLTDEQRKLLEQFFSHFTAEHETELKQRFLRFWCHIADIYHDFNDRLQRQQLAYEGALYRSVVEQLPTASWQYDRYLFVGFNLLQKVEQRLFAALQHEGKAHFYWDFDQYYLKQHEAGRYIAQYLQVFPNELDTADGDIYDQFRQEKTITYISAPTENIQARYVSTWLRDQQRYQDGRKTAIVLCDEHLLPTVIHGLPDEVEKVNVTTGYPLAQTPVASFIQLYYNYHLGGRSPRLKRALHRHPYAIYIDHEDQPLLELLRTIAQKATINDPLFQESMFRAYTLVNRLQALTDSGDLQVTGDTMLRLTNQLLQQTSIPFHGEPAEGVQIMGVLETRNLDFDHVLLLSCQEGNMPKGVNDSSFIPHSIRQAYELTTIENKVSIYAYYFHRLLQRAHDVTILYNNSTEDGQRGEMSRFMLQMMVESNHPITFHSLQAGKQTERWRPQSIAKNERIIQVLKDRPSLSPTAINRYMRCPLQFYYHYVAGIQEPNQADDEQELDSIAFGDIFHEAADSIYRKLPREITAEILDRLLKEKITIERAVDEAFQKELPHVVQGGLHLINREVIIHYLRQLLTIDKRLAPFTILGLEKDVFRPLNIGKMDIGGRIDRLDQMHDGTIRVIDYKTSARVPKTSLNEVDDIFNPEQIHNHADYYLQTFLYADIVRQKTDHPVAPALLFIQHAGSEAYNPILKFGKDLINDVAPYSKRFNELLTQKVKEIFSDETPFAPTQDEKICGNCPYQQMCRR